MVLHYDGIAVLRLFGVRVGSSSRCGCHTATPASIGFTWCALQSATWCCALPPVCVASFLASAAHLHSARACTSALQCNTHRTDSRTRSAVSLPFINSIVNEAYNTGWMATRWIPGGVGLYIAFAVMAPRLHALSKRRGYFTISEVLFDRYSRPSSSHPLVRARSGRGSLGLMHALVPCCPSLWVGPPPPRPSPGWACHLGGAGADSAS